MWLWKKTIALLLLGSSPLFPSRKKMNGLLSCRMVEVGGDPMVEVGGCLVQPPCSSKTRFTTVFRWHVEGQAEACYSWTWGMGCTILATEVEGILGVLWFQPTLPKELWRGDFGQGVMWHISISLNCFMRSAWCSYCWLYKWWSEKAFSKRLREWREGGGKSRWKGGEGSPAFPDKHPRLVLINWLLLFCGWIHPLPQPHYTGSSCSCPTI